LTIALNLQELEMEDQQRTDTEKSRAAWKMTDQIEGLDNGYMKVSK